MLARPLRYPSDWPKSPPEQKGVDVQIAIDMVRMAVRDELDVAILASTDTDLRPALEAFFLLDFATAKTVEVAAWKKPASRSASPLEKLDADAVGGAIARIEAQRSEGMSWLAGELRNAGELREGVSAERAAHILWIAASFDASDLLHSGRGLPADEIAEILVEGAERAICS